ncbi:tetratricopeptide repeat protein [uncultured Microscilla sp.]|uniref:tetratricopeptide repeat protein n=1 Tax=uncultured Microscilla sp. TaxID=432653 RepID=UPI0026122F8B|nr:tetratricopeptide repeat protein [uncultured Microscilla sp.]
MTKTLTLLFVCLCSASLGAFAQPTQSMNLLERADELFYAKRYRKALRVLDQLLKKEPNNYKAHFLKNFIYRDLNEPEKREDAYQKTLVANPHYAEGYYYYGGLLSGQKRLAEARNLYTLGTKKIPQDAEMYHRLGFILDQMKDYPRALAAYNKAIALDPKMYGTYYQRATVYEVFKMYEKALADYTQSLALVPDALTYRTRAQLRFSLGDYSGAMADYRAEARLDTTGRRTFDLKSYRELAFSASSLAYDQWRKKDLAKAQVYGQEALKWVDDPAEKAMLVNQLNEDRKMLRDKPSFDKAQAVYREGMRLIQAKKYQAAYDAFKKAAGLIKGTEYTLDPLYEKLINLQLACLDAIDAARKKD